MHSRGQKGHDWAVNESPDPFAEPPSTPSSTSATSPVPPAAKPALRQLQRAVTGLAVAAAGGALCAWIGTPLPWMIGALLSMALCNFAGAKLTSPPYFREGGQFLVANTLGLYFTPVIFAAMR